MSGHGLIYGEQRNGNLLLRAIPYWGIYPTTQAKAQEIDGKEWCDKSGVDIKAFNDYLVELSGLRFADSDTSGGSSGSRSFVYGVGKKGKHFLLELEKYVNLRPELKLKYKQTPYLSTGMTPGF